MFILFICCKAASRRTIAYIVTRCGNRQ